VDPKELSYSSYSATLAFHMYPSEGQGQPSVLRSVGKVVTDWEIYNAINISRGYSPKMTLIGSPSKKIFVTEGARYFDPTQGTSFNDFQYQDEGGNFMLFGPAMLRTGDPYLLDKTDINNLKLTQDAKRLAYRHNNRINVVFFDGHCDAFDLQESLKPAYYFPKDTYITPSGRFSFQDPTVTDGYIR
jgi:prepilin-type processing-associated H-X9-DG protein